MVHNLLHDFFQMTTVPTNKNGIRGPHPSPSPIWEGSFEEVTHVDLYAWSPMTTGILTDNGLALRSHLKGYDMQMGEEQSGLYRNTSRTEANVPQHMLSR